MIGVVLDLRRVPLEGTTVAVTLKRVQVLKVFVTEIVRSGRLSSGDAASLSGKLGFTITATFGKGGRAKIRPIMKRVYSRIVRLSRDLECCLRWWLRYLRC